MNAGSSDEAAIRERVAEVSLLFRSHGGGVDLVESHDGGREIVVRMTGFCAGCPYKAPCVEHTLLPVLESVDARKVHVQGYAISDEARKSLRRALERVSR